MLVYVNSFDLKKNVETDEVLNTICGWIKHKTENTFTIEMLKSGGDYKYGSITVRSFCATLMQPVMYSVLLSHPDKDINGRYWETEIGIKEENGSTTISILLKINDISTQVKGSAITTRPLLVKYLHDSDLISNETIGLKHLVLKSNKDDIRGFKFEIYRADRKHPIVLVSNRSKNFSTRLQHQLIGLAQVVSVPETMDYGLMESELSQRYSAWDGAINIIQPVYLGSTPRNTLLLSANIDNWEKNGLNVLHEILSLVTHSTNGRYRRDHFSPTDVRAKRQKDQRLKLIDKVSSLKEDKDYKELLNEAMNELDNQQENSISELEDLRAKLIDAESMYYEAESEKATLENDKIISDAKIAHLNNLIENKEIVRTALRMGSEKNLYDGEISGILLDAIISASESAKRYSRRADVLADIITHNSQPEIKENLFEELKILLRDYRSLTPKLREAFSKAKIEIIEDRNHNKAKFTDDERYSVTFAKTASDTHAGMNNLSTIRENLF